MERQGFYVCVSDLDDELLRALGTGNAHAPAPVVTAPDTEPDSLTPATGSGSATAAVQVEVPPGRASAMLA